MEIVGLQMHYSILILLDPYVVWVLPVKILRELSSVIERVRSFFLPTQRLSC